MTSVAFTEEQDNELEDIVSRAQFIQRLRSLADALEKNPAVQVRVGDTDIAVPANATYSIEFEAEDDEEELEFQIKWTPGSV